MNLTRAHVVRIANVLAICALAFGLFLAAAVWVKCETKHETFARLDLYAGLMYYLEDHGGQFPPSREAFFSSRFVQVEPRGVRIKERRASRFRPNCYGALIRHDLLSSVAWGTDLSSLQARSDGTLTDDGGREFLVVNDGARWANVWRQCTRALVEAANEVQGRRPARH